MNLVSVVHRQGNTSWSLEVKHNMLLFWRAIAGLEVQGQLATRLDHHISCSVLYFIIAKKDIRLKIISQWTDEKVYYLITKSVSAHDDWVLPTGHEQGNIFTFDGLTEYGAAQHVTQRTVRAEPHFFQVELFLNPSIK